MEIRHAVSGAVFVLLAASSVSSTLDAQERHRVRGEDGDRRTLTIVNSMFGNRMDRARLGVSVDRHQPTRYDERGARVTGVLRNSPAWDAGLEEGDIVTSINGQSLTARLDAEIEDDFDRDESMPAQRLVALVRELESGEEIEVDYIRNGESESVTVELEEADEHWIGSREPLSLYLGRDGDDSHVVLGKQLQELSELARMEGLKALELSQNRVWDVQALTQDRWFGRGGVERCPSGSPAFGGDGSGCLIGTEIREIEAELGSYFDVDGGLLVVDAAEDNPLGLEAGDVILRIGTREIASFRRLRRLISSFDADETITLTVMRNGNEVELEGTLD